MGKVTNGLADARQQKIQRSLKGFHFELFVLEKLVQVGQDQINLQPPDSCCRNNTYEFIHPLREYFCNRPHAKKLAYFFLPLIVIFRVHSVIDGNFSGSTRITRDTKLPVK